MKREKIFFSAIMAFAILFSSLLGPGLIVNADDELKASNIPLISNMVYESEIQVYKYQDKIYLKTSDVARLTGAKLLDKPNNPSKAWFYYGVELDTQQAAVSSLSSRYIIIDFDKKTISEIAGAVQNTAPINVISQDGIQYIHAYSILTALGAMCKIEDGVLIVTTPLHSFWDALKSESEIRTSTNLSAEREYGNTASLRIGIDLFVDLFTPGGVADVFNPIGNISGAITNQVDADVLEQALYVSIDKYSSVQESVVSTNMRIDSFTENFAIAKDFAELSNKLSIEVVMNELVQNGLLSERGSYQQVLQALKQSENVADYNLLSDMKLASDAMTGIKAALEFSATISNRLGVEPARISALADTFSEENLEKAIGTGGYPRFFGNARDSAQTLASKGSTILATTAETLWNEIGSEKLSEAIISNGVKKAFGSAAGGLVAALQIEGILIKLIIPGQIESVSSDIYLYKAMAQLEWEDLIATNWLLIAKDEAYTNEESLISLRNSLIIYYQTCLYAHKLILSMINNSPERYGSVGDTLKASEEADCEKIAETLYKLYSSQPAAVPKFDSLLALSSEFDKQAVLSASPVPQEPDSINIFGNTPGNIVNRGRAVKQGNLIYYASDSGIYKMSADGTGVTKLSDNEALYLNVVDDWIYYSNENMDDLLYKMRTDGTGNTRLSDETVSYINVVYGWIYYSESRVDERGYDIYKMRTDGTDRMKLSSDPIYRVSNLNVADNWIYYIDSIDDNYGSLCKMRTDGTDAETMIIDAVSSVNVVDGWIYYSNGFDVGFYKMRTDGTTQTKLGEWDILCMNVSDGWVYFANASDDYRMYKMRTDGSNGTALTEDGAMEFNVVGDWIYYLKSGNEGYTLFRIRMDGTDNQAVK